MIIAGRDTTLRGVVTWFNGAKGYGVIRRTIGAGSLLVSIDAVRAAGLSTLQPGQAVLFEAGTDRGKAAAINLRLA